MRLAVMQPYFFPYVGYFQLIAGVDRFIVLDDVNYIVRGWVNRNRILVKGEPSYFTLPLSGGSQNVLINEISISEEFPKWRQKFMKTLKYNYSNAPYYKECVEVVDAVLGYGERNLSKFLVHGLRVVCAYLGINTEFVETSVGYGKNGHAGADRIVDLCLKNHAQVYLNPPGGRSLYSKDSFESHCIKLEFLEPVMPAYPHNASSFCPGLSIIDVMMWNSPAECCAV